MSTTTRIAFRFTFIYVSLYVLTTQMLGALLLIPKVDIPDFGKLPPIRPMAMWVGRHLLHGNPIIAPTGSGDTFYDYSQVTTLLLIALLGTITWSLSARNDASYGRLHKWFRLFLRFALGTTMLTYGFFKLWPMQMPPLFLNRLLEPFGNFSPMGVIWYSIGAAPWYERFIGSTEILGGALLFLPRTARLGAMVCFGVTLGVFVINMTYDVPVKLFSFQLVIFSLVLLAPDASRLFTFLLTNRAVAPAPEPFYGRSAGSNRAWRVGQAVFGVWLLGMSVQGSMRDWKIFGGAAPRSALFGIWDVDSMSINGELRPPLASDSARYQYLVFQNTAFGFFWHMDRTFVQLGTKIDTLKRTIDLKKRTDSTWKATLAYQRPTAEQLLLDGDMDGKKLHMRLSLHDLNKFLLVTRGFNWVQELPFNK